MNKGQPITKEQADQLQAEGAAMLFDCIEAECMGYFSANNGNANLVVVTDQGYFLRKVEELQVGPDGVFVRLPEDDDGTPLPSFKEAFTIVQI